MADPSNLSAVLCDPERLAQALSQAKLSEKELHWLRSTVQLSYGTALRGAQAAGSGGAMAGAP